MKKCPKCGNPSYDGAPVCGNCGYKFPKPKVVAPKEELIFNKEQPQVKKEEEDTETVIGIIKKNRYLIGIIVFITLIVICAIVLSGSGNNTNSITADGNAKYSDAGFSFSYPATWKKINQSDAERDGAIFFKNDNNTVIEFYNVTSDATSLKEIVQQRISNAQQNGSYVDTVRTITLDDRNSSEIIIETAGGDYERYITMFSKGELYVFKISGDSVNSVTSPDIESAINSADIA